jgi:hypothetical protein
MTHTRPADISECCATADHLAEPLSRMLAPSDAGWRASPRRQDDGGDCREGRADSLAAFTGSSPVKAPVGRPCLSDDGAGALQPSGLAPSDPLGRPTNAGRPGGGHVARATTNVVGSSRVALLRPDWRLRSRRRRRSTSPLRMPSAHTSGDLWQPQPVSISSLDRPGGPWPNRFCGRSSPNPTTTPHR